METFVIVAFEYPNVYKYESERERNIQKQDILFLF